jgi:SAM-dependent methyltransferase
LAVDETDNEALWERHARWWQRAYSDGADLEYEHQILPLVAEYVGRAQRVLDVGCGEGQVARHLAGLGCEVVGLDPIMAQVEVARDRAGGPQYARARADALPCGDATFDCVLVCLALEHVDEFETALREVARVLEPGGRFVLLLSHPLLQAPRSGWVDDRTVDEHYWRVGGYLRDDVVVDEIAPGVALRFIHRPLGRYVRALGDAGLLIDDMCEPSPPAPLLVDEWDFAEAAAIPRVLLLRARRVPVSRPR